MQTQARFKRREPISGLPPIAECPIGIKIGSMEVFFKCEVADAFGAPHWQITRDAQALWGDRTDHKPLTRKEARTLYYVACYRRFCNKVLEQERVSMGQIREFAELPADKISSLVEAVGGSEADFEERIDGLILKRQLTKLGA